MKSYTVIERPRDLRIKDKRIEMSSEEFLSYAKSFIPEIFRDEKEVLDDINFINSGEDENWLFGNARQDLDRILVHYNGGLKNEKEIN